MQGAGNDYIYVNLSQEELSKSPAELAQMLCDRHFGIGGDGLVLIDKGQGTDLTMRMFNADGSEAEMCGNAVRCVAFYGLINGLTDKKSVSVHTKAGVKQIEILEVNPARIRVNMGVPDLRPAFLPARVEGERVLDQEFDFGGTKIRGSLVSMGNPHLVTFVDNLDTLDIETLGPLIEQDPRFPNRINIEFVQVFSPERARQRTWERGSGETLACGTGASAVLVAGALTGRLGRKAHITLLGGELTLEWEGEGKPLFMTGGAVKVFDGELDY